MSLRLLTISSFVVSGVFGSLGGSGPVVFEPSGEWNGDDGQFATFHLTVGAPAQKVQVLPDPFRNAVVLIGPEGCQNDSLFPECSSKRGNIYHRTESSSWQEVERQRWDPTETVIAPPRRGSENGSVTKQDGMFQHAVALGGGNNLGMDQVGGESGGKQWSIPDQGIMSVVNMNPFVGRLGLSTRINGQAKTPVSLFDNVRAALKLKSASWSYTAGRKAGNVPGSLILGGYDASRIEKSTTLAALQARPDQTFIFNLKTLVVKAPGVNDPVGQHWIALGGVPVSIDFTRPHLEFPESVCNRLSEELGIDYDPRLRHYVVNDTRHNDLVASGASITFVMTGTQGPQKQFIIPYQSLVLEGSFPSVREPTRYLAIRRSGSERFNLGRAFLQDTYLTAEFDRPSGTYAYLSQARYVSGTPSKVKEMDPHRFVRRTRHKDNNLGIILPVVFVVLALICMALYIVWARKAGWAPFSKKAETTHVAPSEEDDASPPYQYHADRKQVYVQTEEDTAGSSVPPPPRYSVAIAEGAKKPEGG